MSDDHEPRVPVPCAQWRCVQALYVERRHADNIPAAGWRCSIHRSDATKETSDRD